MQITERVTSSIWTSSSSQVFSNGYLFIYLIFEPRFDKIYNLIVLNNVYTNLHFLPIFMTYLHGVIL